MKNKKNKNKIKVPARAGIWYIVTSILSRGIGMIGTPVFSRLLTVEEYGIYPLYITWLGIVTSFATLELTGSVIYRGMQKFEERKDGFLSATMGLFLSVFIPCSILYFIFQKPINSLTGLSTEIFIFLFLNIFFNTVTAFYIARQKFEYKYKSTALVNLSVALLTPVLSVFFVLKTSLGGVGRIIGTVAVSGIIAIPLFIKILKKNKKLFDKEIWKFLLKFNLPLLPHYFSMSIILRVGEAVVGRVFGKVALAKYSVTMSLGLSLTMISSGAISALSPWIMRKIRENKLSETKEIIEPSAKALGILTLLILSLSPETLRIIAPYEYTDALICVFPLSLCVLPMYLSNTLMSAELYYEKNITATVPSLVSAAVSVALSLIFLPLFDYRAVAFYALVSYIILALLNTVNFKKISGTNLFSPYKIFLSFLFVAIYSIPIFLLREYFLARVILAVALLPMMIYYGIKILNKIREPKKA